MDAAEVTREKLTLPGEPCQIQPRSSWTPQEQWVWKQVCEGSIADFNTADGYGGWLDPKKPADWPVSRVLRPTFLETILLHEPWRSSVPRQGVYIIGAWFKETLDLSNAELGCMLRLEYSQFALKILLSRLRTHHLISFDGSIVKGALNMAGLNAGSDLFMNEATFAQVNLQDAQIEGLLDLRKATFKGALNMAGLNAGSPLFMNEATFTQVNLQDAQIEGLLDMSKATFKGELYMAGLNAGSPLFMNEATFAQVDLQDAQIEGQLDIRKATFKGELYMAGLNAGSSLFMSEATFAQVNLQDAHIESVLNMSKAIFKGALYMTNLNAGSDLFMNEATFAQVNLQDAQIKGRLDMSKATCDKVQLQDAQIEGVFNMSKATFKGALYMTGLNAGSPLFMNEATFAQVDLQGAQIKGRLDMSKAIFKGALYMPNLHAGSPLFMSEATFAQVDLQGAQIEEVFNMSKATFTGGLYMTGLNAGSPLFMNEATFAQVDLQGAQIKGQLNMSKAIFKGALNMAALHAGSDLFMNEAIFAQVNLQNAQIEGVLNMSKGIFKGALYMTNLRVGSDLFMRDGGFTKAPFISIISATIGTNLELWGSQDLPSLTLTGTAIGGELRLTSGSSVPKWRPGSQLTLRNTKVGALHDALMVKQNIPKADAWKVWPDTLELDGFTYDRLGGLATQGEAEMAERSVSWFETWLKKQPHYAPQPYQQLAKVLRDTGHKDKSTAILYASKRREHIETSHWWQLNSWWLTLQRLFIGYGYYNFQVLWWVLIFCVMGVLVLRCSGQGAKHKMPYGIIYSIGMLLPIIELHKPHYEIALDGWARWYFYGHKIAGYLLASFLVAGLAGLTKQ